MLLRCDEAGGEALCESFDVVGFNQHAGLAAKQRVDTGAQARPIGLWQVEMAAEVEQGDLADLLACALGGDEPEGEIWFVGGVIPGCGFANEHAVEREGGGVRRQEFLKRLWHYKDLSRRLWRISAAFPVFITVSAGWTAKLGLTSRDFPIRRPARLDQHAAMTILPSPNQRCPTCQRISTC